MDCEVGCIVSYPVLLHNYVAFGKLLYVSGYLSIKSQDIIHRDTMELFELMHIKYSVQARCDGTHL
jgi:hypothetical protein